MTQDKCQGCAVQQGTHVPMGAVIHPDDLAVDALAKAMKAKLAKKRAQGYGGWDTDCTQQRLSDLLRKHVDKGDPIDVANLCAFLLARGEGIAALQSAQAAPQASEPYAVLVFERGEEGPFDRKPVKPNSMPHLLAKLIPHYDYIELYTHPTQQGLERQKIDPLRQMLAQHEAHIEQNPHAYFELAYTRSTGWMVWITDKPLCSPVVNPDRKVLWSGQGETPDEACENAALAAQAKQGGAA